MDTAAAQTQSAEHAAVHCMEVWGGNSAAQDSFRRPGFDLWVWSRPQGNSEVDGGDVHFLSSCASGRITRLLIAEVCAQGSAFSQLAAELRTLMMENINKIKQGNFLRDMNQRLQTCAGHGTFATALIATFFAPTKSFSLCNTGHPPPFLFRAEQQEWSVLKQPPAELLDLDRVPQGHVDVDEYQHFRLRLESDDMVLCYSNALTECRDAADHYLGVDGLLKRVKKLDPDQPSEIVSKLVGQILEENATNLAEHDATVILCRATDTCVSWKDSLLAPFRLLRAASDRTQVS